MFGLGVGNGHGYYGSVGGALAPKTPRDVFVADPALASSNTNLNTNFRAIITLTETMGPEWRVWIEPGNVNALTADHVGLGKGVGNETSPNAAAALTEAKFGGVNGFVNATTPQASDWMPSGTMNGMPPGTQVILSCNTGGAGQGDMAYVSDPNGMIQFFKADKTAWGDATVTGYSETGFNFGNMRIETRGGSPYTDPSVNKIPLTFDDPLFNRNLSTASPVIVAIGESISHRTIEEYVSALSSTLDFKGDTVGEVLSISSRECVRISGSGDVTLRWCYFNAIGNEAEGDHADTVQIFAVGGRGDTVTLENCTVEAGEIAATAGMFCADDWGGTIVLRKTVFKGGPYGLKVTADPTCEIDLYLEDVYFVGPFVSGPYVFQNNSGTVLIKQWDNVRWATIVDGELVPGDLIPAPGGFTNRILGADGDYLKGADGAYLNHS